MSIKLLEALRGALRACIDINAITTDYEWYSCLKRYDALF